MPLECQERIIAYHAATVVGDVNELLAPCLDLNLYASGSGIEGVLQ